VGAAVPGTRLLLPRFDDDESVHCALHNGTDNRDQDRMKGQTGADDADT